MMQIRIAGRQIEIGLGLPHRVRKKLGAMVSKYFDRNAEASVTFMKERTGFRTVCSVHFSSGALMQAQGTGPTASRAFDMALDHPVDFDSMDDQPVDLVFLLLAPEGAGADHRKALARVSRLLRNQAVCEKLRAAPQAATLFALLTEPTAAQAA